MFISAKHNAGMPLSRTAAYLTPGHRLRAWCRSSDRGLRAAAKQAQARVLLVNSGDVATKLHIHGHSGVRTIGRRDVWQWRPIHGNLASQTYSFAGSTSQNQN